MLSDEVAFELRQSQGNEEPAMRLSEGEAPQTEGIAHAKVLRQEPHKETTGLQGLVRGMVRDKAEARSQGVSGVKAWT